MSHHYVERCSCGAVIAQCRCPGPKTERMSLEACPACQRVQSTTAPLKPGAPMAIDNPIRMKDVLGHTVLISQAELLAALTAAKTLLVFGMDIEAILALRTKYIEAGGALPITSAAIQTVINPTREEDPCP